MKKFLAFLACAMFAVPTFAQEAKEEKKGFKFEVVKEIPITPIKDQNQAGTCWSYSGLALIEAELLRMGKGEYDLSEMFVVFNTYMDRARAAVRTHGDVSFSQGGSFYDVLYAMENYGLVPDCEMPAGVMYGETLSNHTELSAIADAAVNAIAEGKLRQLQSKDNQVLWEKAVRAIHEVYLGECPTEFEYNGTTYTPIEFYNSLGLNADDYVSLTSYTHHPFYSQFVLEIPDNLMQVFDNAIDKGYTIAWGSDVSESGWLRGDMSGIAVLPDMEAKTQDLTGSDMAHWLGLSAADRQKAAKSEPTPQRWVTQEERQLAYDDYTTTDDHGMLIYGTAKDQLGNEYYMVKNSWGDYGQYNGMLYASKAFVRYKTMNIVVHKDALPKDIKKKLGIK